MEIPEVTNAIRKEAKFCIEVIEDNKLFDLSMDLGAEEKTWTWKPKPGST